MLRRIAHDPELLRRRYSAFGRLTVAELTTFQRQLIEEANRLEDNAGPTPVDIEQDADSDEAFFSTDEDGWGKRTSLDSHILQQEEL